MITTPSVRVVSDLQQVYELTHGGGISDGDIRQLLAAVERDGGVCTCWSAERNGVWVWLMAFILDEGVRLIAVQSADHQYLGGLNYDIQSWLVAEQRAGRKPGKRDVVQAMLAIIHGDDGEAVLQAMEKEGSL